MPEYLAPAVYVEETSFRAKSIEGVSTSTTGFAGLCLTGPSSGTPSLVTSFAEFQRMYGGIDNLVLSGVSDETKKLNYLAHAVRAYFDEGGSRLYVARVVPSGAGTSTLTIGGVAKFDARFAGSAGNGTVSLKVSYKGAPVSAAYRAPVGSMMRVMQAAVSATSATLTGTVAGPAFELRAGATLVVSLQMAGAAAVQQTLTFQAKKAELFGSSALADVVVDDTNDTLRVDVDGVVQSITLEHSAGDPAVARTVASLVTELNRKLRGGYARLSEAADGGTEGRLVLGGDCAGTDGSVEVIASSSALTALGLAAGKVVSARDAVSNNVGNLAAVDVNDLNDIFDDLGLDVTASLNADRVEFSAPAGVNVLMVRNSGTANAVFGFPVSPAADASSTGVETSASQYFYYVKASDGTWTQEAATTPIDINATITTKMANESTRGDAIGEGAQLLEFSVGFAGSDGRGMGWEGLGLSSDHPRYMGNVLKAVPSTQGEQLTNPIQFSVVGSPTVFTLLSALLGGKDEQSHTLSGGTDGGEPSGAEYKSALDRLIAVEDISIVATPGSSAYSSARETVRELIKHVETRRSYRIAVVDSLMNEGDDGVKKFRSEMDSKYAGLYYPWVVVANPLAKMGDDSIPREIKLPPSGFVCGIYARNDIERGVIKAPANEVVRSALRFSEDVNFARQEVLNPLGINCLRFFPGRGYRVWGARTVSSDPEWKYVNIRRYFNYLERSIDMGTQWAVFEPNGERLWANIRETIDSFLYNEWKSGALLGTDPKQAYFVRCDRSTMTQNDLDNGRLICLIGVAAIKPAEFVIFRIGQKTADASS